MTDFRAHCYFLVRHYDFFLGIGFLAACMAFQIPIATWRRLAPWLFIGCAFLHSVGAHTPGIGSQSEWQPVAGFLWITSPCNRRAT
jgi:cell division protein FtsW (lipid II flippase)